MAQPVALSPRVHRSDDFRCDSRACPLKQTPHPCPSGFSCFLVMPGRRLNPCGNEDLRKSLAARGARHRRYPGVEVETGAAGEAGAARCSEDSGVVAGGVAGGNRPAAGCRVAGDVAGTRVVPASRRRGLAADRSDVFRNLRAAAVPGLAPESRSAVHDRGPAGNRRDPADSRPLRSPRPADAAENRH